MTHGSLFSGIGGFDLAAEWMGWENRFHCEINPFGQKVLKYYWPEAESFTDITKTDFTKYANRIDILTGGFPCQPYSTAGKRKGKEDNRHLWPEMLRAIREIQPCWVVGENVRGLTNWNGGMVFDEVQADLEAEGYEVLPFLLPACTVNAPHRRDRIWFIAYRNSKQREWQAEGFQPIPINESSGVTSNSHRNGRQRGNSEHEVNTSERGEYAQHDIIQSVVNGNVADTESERHELSGITWERGTGFENSNSNENITNPSNKGLQRCKVNGNIASSRQERNKQFAGRISSNWEKFPTQSPLCTGNDGFPNRLDGITFSKWRNESIKAAGNAIVPQVVLQIFKTIEQYENNLR